MPDSWVYLAAFSLYEGLVLDFPSVLLVFPQILLASLASLSQMDQIGFLWVGQGAIYLYANTELNLSVIFAKKKKKKAIGKK